MAKEITIDLNKWTTQAKKAEQSGILLTTISQQVVRTQKGLTPNPIDILEIPELGIVLVRKDQEVVLRK